MLSRTADHLYWMSRYIERAENMARMIDAQSPACSVTSAPEAVLQGWQATLVSLGMDSHYRERNDTLTPTAAFDFLAFDSRAFREHPALPARGPGKCPGGPRHHHVRHVETLTRPTSNRTPSTPACRNPGAAISSSG